MLFIKKQFIFKYIIIILLIALPILILLTKVASNKEKVYTLPNLYYNLAAVNSEQSNNTESIKIVSDILINEYKKDYSNNKSELEIQYFNNENSNNLHRRLLDDYFFALNTAFDNNLIVSEDDKTIIKKITNSELYNIVKSIEGLINENTFNTFLINFRNPLYLKLQSEIIELKKLNSLSNEIDRYGIDSFKNALIQLDYK